MQVDSSNKLQEVRKDYILDPFQKLPFEIILYIFFQLGACDLGRAQCVNRSWKHLASNPLFVKGIVNRELRQLKEKFGFTYFGIEDWQKYFGDVGEVRPFPLKIFKALYKVVKGKKVAETHGLIYIPATVNGKPFMLKRLGKLVQSPDNGGYKTVMDCDWGGIMKKYKDKPASKSYWVLMTKDILKGSKNLCCSYQIKPVDKLAEITGLDYKIPKIFPAAVFILTHYVKYGERLYNDNPITFTRSQEKINNLSLSVGLYTPEGLFVGRDFHNITYYGVGALCKFTS